MAERMDIENRIISSNFTNILPCVLNDNFQASKVATMWLLISQTSPSDPRQEQVT